MFLIACNSTLRLTCLTCVYDYILWPTGFMVTMFVFLLYYFFSFFFTIFLYFYYYSVSTFCGE